MHAEHGTALRAGPFGILVFYKTVHAGLFYPLQVIQWAELILDRITLLQADQRLTGEIGTFVAILKLT